MSVAAKRSKRVEVLCEDAHLLVVDKPAGVLSVPGRGGEPGLIEVLRSGGIVQADGELRMIHRLDRDASGVIALARTLAAQRKLVEQFRARTVEKTYLALVQGFVAGDGEVDLPLTVDRKRMAVKVGGSKAKPAVTRYRVLERVAGHTLLECRPMTGRMHQIRVHLAAAGHPLAVDPVYGGREAVWLSQYKADFRPNRTRAERPLMARLSLHAARLTLEHPGDGAVVTFEAPMPKDFRATLNQLGRL